MAGKLLCFFTRFRLIGRKLRRCVGEGGGDAARIVENSVAERDEIRAGFGEIADLAQCARIGDAGNIEDFRPPGDARDDILMRLRAAQGPEHHIIDAEFARRHGRVARSEGARTDDAAGPQGGDRGLKRFAGALDVTAVGLSAERKLRVADDQRGDVAALNYRGKRGDDLFVFACVAPFGAEQDAGDVAGRQRRLELRREGGGVADRAA